MIIRTLFDNVYIYKVRAKFNCCYSVFKSFPELTNIPDRSLALRFYKRRMWIEEMFGDMKKHGFDLESSMLHSFVRLSRLTLAVAILYVWSIAIGVRAVHQGQRHLVDRIDRRDLSIFQIGLRTIERYLTNAHFVPVLLCDYQ